MTTVAYQIVPIPLWLFNQIDGKPLGGGYMKTWRSVDFSTPKPIYTDSSGQFAWPNPVLFNANGEAPGPFFWADDEPYFIEIFAADNTLVFTMFNYGPGIAGGGGGGGTITVNNNLENFVVNNVFWRYGSDVGSADTFANIQSGQVIAPSNHAGFVKNATGLPDLPFSGPDVMFVRSNNLGTDSIQFAKADFNAGLIPLFPDVTPDVYVDAVCSAAGGATNKAVQFPINLHVKNLEQQPMTAMIWARGVSGTQNLTLSFVQYFGTSSGTSPVVTPISIGASPLANTWQLYRGSFIVPSIAGKTLSAVGDDANYLQVGLPASAAFEILFTKPKLYLGTVGAVFSELQTPDNIDRVISSPRTGDVRVTDNALGLGIGWVPMQDGSIGSQASAATARANVDTWPLYATLYVNVGDSLAPVSGGRTAPGNTVAAAYTDFVANKTLTLTRAAGRAIAATGTGSGLTARTLANFNGSEVITINAMPLHDHPGSAVHTSAVPAGGAFAASSNVGGPNINLDIAAQGGGILNVQGAADGNMQPTNFYNFYIKL